MQKTLKPLKNNILFKFEDAVKNGMFEHHTEWGFTLTTFYEDSAKLSRVGIVTEIGPDVPNTIKVGDRILIDALMWTTGVKFEDRTIWKTNSDKVIGILK